MNDVSSKMSTRLTREKRTIEAMIGIYCRGNHATGVGERLCAECEALLNYALGRLDRCPFGQKKLPCAKCHIHCYKPSRRKQIKAIMRYAGPRMLWRHPLLALGHWLDDYRFAQTIIQTNKVSRNEAENRSDASTDEPHS